MVTFEEGSGINVEVTNVDEISAGTALIFAGRAIIDRVATEELQRSGLLADTAANAAPGVTAMVEAEIGRERPASPRTHREPPRIGDSVRARVDEALKAGRDPEEAETLERMRARDMEKVNQGPSAEPRFNGHRERRGFNPKPRGK